MMGLWMLIGVDTLKLRLGFSYSSFVTTDNRMFQKIHSLRHSDVAMVPEPKL